MLTDKTRLPNVKYYREVLRSACSSLTRRANQIMKSFLATILRTPGNRHFASNVIKLTFSTGLAQSITMLATPLIARQYGPSAFGEQSILLSVAGLLSIATSMSFPLAIVVAEDDREAGALRLLALGGGLIFTPLIIASSFVNEAWVLTFFGIAGLAHLAFFVFIATILLIANTSGSYMLIRRSDFDLSAKLSIASSLTGNAVKIILGALAPSTIALILANFIGYLVVPLAVNWRYRLTNRSIGLVSRSELASVAFRYRDFPYWRTPQNFINAASQSLPIFALASAFGPASTGQYAVALAIISAPATLIGNSIQSAFYPRINTALQEGADVASLLKRLTFVTMLVAIPPFLLIGLFGTMIFQLFLGTEWADAGTFASVLAPWVWLGVANKPVVAAIPGLNLQRDLLLYELVSTSLKVVAIYLGVHSFRDPTWTIILFSGVGSAAYVFLIAWVLIVSNRARARHA